MKSEKEIIAAIRKTEKENKHVLTGPASTVRVNAPRALQQVAVESYLRALYGVLNRTYKSKLKGIDL